MHRWPKKLGLALAVILILPVAETATLFAVARRLGVGWTVLLLAAAMAAGIYVFLVAGPRRISGLRQALVRGELPAPP
ncbi:MAG: FxsA family protein, partial [Clostridia bacterium]|nr:FxsA family protein [Clostridia bacterium]